MTHNTSYPTFPLIRGRRMTPDSGFYRVVDTVTSISWETLCGDMELEWRATPLQPGGLQVWECYCALLCPTVLHMPSSSSGDHWSVDASVSSEGRGGGSSPGGTDLATIVWRSLTPL